MLAAFVENRFRAAGSAACDADLADGNQTLEVADSSRRFDLHVIRSVRHHQTQIVVCCPAGTRSS